jgi:integrase
MDDERANIMAIEDFPPSWRNAVRSYLLDVESRSSASNCRFRESRLKAVSNWAGENEIDLDDYRKVHLQQFLIDRGKDGISENTRYHDYQTAKMFMTWCFEEDFIASNPLAKYKMKSPAEVEGSRPTVEHLKLLLRAVQDRNDLKINDKIRNQSPKVCRFLAARERAIIMLLVDSGARIGSVLGMELADYQPQELQTVLRRTKNGKVSFKPISEDSVKAIDAYLAIRPIVDCNRLFVSLLGDALDSAAYGKVFARYVDFAGIPPITLHSLRRYTLSAMAATNFWAAVSLADHQDARTTRRYAKHVPSEVREAHAVCAPLGRVTGSTSAKEIQRKSRKRVIR